ncbi:MAG: hypothetical protein ACYC4N_17890 [Pirellulaceae bacterium]
MPTFADVVEAADKLSVDEQENLLAILRRRIAERNRAQIVCDVQSSRAEHADGQTQMSTVTQIMDEAARES